MSFTRWSIERLIRVLVLIVVAIAAAFVCSCSDYKEPVGVNDAVALDGGQPMLRTNAASEKEWTFLLYSAADAGPTYGPLADFAAKFASGAGVNALCLQDTYGAPAGLWYIDENHQPVLLEDLGEVNTGSVTTLSNFLSYAKTNYPARRYIAAFYGHGGAWGGVCPDVDPEFDVLRMPDMQQALEGVGGVDLVMFPAPCTMASLEVAYQLRGCADVMVACEDLSYYALWTNVMGSISNELNSNPAVSSVELSRLMLDWLENDKRSYVHYGGLHYLAMSAVRMDRLDALREAVDDLALAYLDDPSRFKAELESVRHKITYFDETWIADLNSILTNLHKKESDPSIRAKLENVMYSLSDAVISEVYLSKYKGVGGLSVFLPDAASADMGNYYVDDEFGLEFVQDSHWDELMSQLYPPAGAAEPAVGASNALLFGRSTR